jgi:hypothetical protein
MVEPLQGKMAIPDMECYNHFVVLAVLVVLE